MRFPNWLRNTITIFLLFVSPLLGLVSMWLITNWAKKTKWIITGVYLFVLMLMLVIIVSLVFVSALIAQPLKVSGRAMYPALDNNEYLLTKTLKIDPSPLKRGEIVVFANPRDKDQSMIKRVVGLPGEEIKIQNGEIYIEGQPLDEDYLENDVQTNPGPFIPEGQAVFIPTDSYIVMGDNRVASSDSREYGFVPVKSITGRYWFSYSY